MADVGKLPAAADRLAEALADLDEDAVVAEVRSRRSSNFRPGRRKLCVEMIVPEETIQTVTTDPLYILPETWFSGLKRTSAN